MGLSSLHLASVGVLLGEAALVLDLGNRLFGCYVRTAWAFAWRVTVCVGAFVLLASPACWLVVEPRSAGAAVLMRCAGALGFLILLHYLVPYRWGMRRAAGSVGPGSVSPLTEDTVLRHQIVWIDSLPPQNDGFNALVLSDLHCNSQEALEQLRQCCHELRPRIADCVFLLGDFGESNPLLPEIIAAVRRLRSRWGTYCVRGNHDLEGTRGELIGQLLDRQYIRLLPNAVHELPGGRMALLGLEPGCRADLQGQLPAGCFVLGLTHSPDAIRRLGRLGVDFALAGHTHGGSLRLPFIGPLLVPSRFGRLPDRGLFRYRKTLMFVMRGFGYGWGRFGARGEVLLLELRRPEDQRPAEPREIAEEMETPDGQGSARDIPTES